MLIAKGNDPNAMANSGGTSLMFAAGAGHMEAAAVLIEAGADVNAKLKATSEFLDQVGRACCLRFFVINGAKYGVPRCSFLCYVAFLLLHLQAITQELSGVCYTYVLFLCRS